MHLKGDIKMNKKWIYIKRIISMILFFVMVASLYWYVDRTMKLKRTDGITPMQNYYLQPEGQVDVLHRKLRIKK